MPASIATVSAEAFFPFALPTNCTDYGGRPLPAAPVSRACRASRRRPWICDGRRR